MKKKRYEAPDIKGIDHKPMPDYEDAYEIYFDGRVWSKYSGKFIHLQDNGRGYLQFQACKNGIKTPRLVHQVVAETFIRPIQRDQNGRALEQINHRSRVRDQNTPSNIQILSSEQHHHFHTGQMNGNTGRVMSEEQKIKTRATREARKLQDPNRYRFNVGRVVSQEQKAKTLATREAKKVENPDYYKKSEQTIEKAKQTRIANGTYRRKHTEEELKKISQSNKGKHFQSEEQKAKTKATREARKAENPDYYKRKASPEAIEKRLNTIASKRAVDPNYGKSMLGKHQSEQTKEKIRQALKGKKKSAEHVAKMIQTKKLKKQAKLEILNETR